MLFAVWGGLLSGLEPPGRRPFVDDFLHVVIPSVRPLGELQDVLSPAEESVVTLPGEVGAEVRLAQIGDEDVLARCRRQARGERRVRDRHEQASIDGLTTAYAYGFARVAPVRDRTGFRARITTVEREGFAEVVGARPEEDRDAARWPVHCSDSIPGSGEGLERSLSGAGVAVIALGRNPDLGAGARETELRSGEHHEGRECEPAGCGGEFIHGTRFHLSRLQERANAAALRATFSKACRYWSMSSAAGTRKPGRAIVL